MRGRPPAPEARRLISPADLRQPAFRRAMTSIRALLLAAVIIEGAGPVYWMAKSSITGTQELLHHPLTIWPSHALWSNLADAWTQLQIGHYLLNTVVLVAGVWIVHVFIATTAGYALSVLRPWYGKYVYGAILATLFLPGTVTLVALYLTVAHLPVTGGSLLNNPAAVWLPAGANAFDILLMKRFFDAIPRDLFEAARIDGAGPFGVFWRVVLPLSAPVLAVVSLLSVVTAWKDFLWPLLVITNDSAQPLSVALPRLAQFSSEALLLAGMFIASVPPLIIYVIFQRYIIRGISFTGVKG